ncbi:RsmD family RNA methyltransferase [Flagellimonas flava]|uniref:16S rRNA (Guanine(966)-N(2))-methyltransferase RsmD n=1 Tax=Flagellimonas flava TaxID=570519 RepID=A0A1M5P5F6_9FLAO|nr:RsmD family RNA methyltransferase [Allomuricauda flava]SHG97026.1 16S rRNA (guanine(966)-N(2))-methyltransferase RsmD [Allomuricauda flava]
MRIISGKFKGKRISAPKKLPVRPTTDMAKEGLFNILNNRFYLDDLKVLDLFAGTGNISFEFASRGCNELTAVDGFPGCVQFIAKVAKELDSPMTAVKSDVFKFLERTTDKFNLIFADPPYSFEDSKFETLVNMVFANKHLLEDGLLVVEHSSLTDLSQHPCFSESRKYGGSVFSFFEAETGQEI